MDISELVATITQHAANASTTITEVDAEIERKSDRAEGVLRDFDAIVDEVGNFHHSIREIPEATDQGAQTVTDAVGMVNEIASVSEGHPVGVTATDGGEKTAFD